MFGYNLNVAIVSGLAGGGLHVWAHNYFAGWSYSQGIESTVTYVMVVSAFVATYALLAEKDSYHN